MHPIRVEWVEDLIWYDGPLLSVVRSGEQRYLDLWVDVREGGRAPEGFRYQIDVRCLVKISDENLAALLANTLALHDAIVRSEFILHFVGSLACPQELKVWSPQEMREHGCMPEPGVFLRPDSDE